jgi:hypothetical protein
MDFEGGKLTLPRDLSYYVMVIPDKTAISPVVLRKLEKLIYAGAVVFGPKPLQSNSLVDFPSCDEEVRKLGEKIWGNCDGKSVTSNQYGKGKVYYGLPLWQVMKAEGIARDFDAQGFDNSDQHIDYIHRRNGEDDVYFVSNSGLIQQKFTARFRISEEKIPYLWFADNGTIQPCKVLSSDKQFTTIELDLPPVGSVFVVFQPKNKPAAVSQPDILTALNENNLAPAVYPDKPWKVTFPEGRGAPASIMMDELSDWTSSTIDGVKYFSGSATYSTAFTMEESAVKAGKGLILDLGTVKEIAVVKINGVVVDTLWKPPYQTAIGKFVNPGKNNLELVVTNLWHNRLVGDVGKPEAEMTTRTNIQNRYRNNMPLLPSGLIGPVVIR